MHSRSRIYRFRVTDRKIDFIAESSGRGLGLRWDQNKLYFLKDSDGSDGRIHIFDITTGRLSSETVGGYGLTDPEGAWYFNQDPIDKNGDLWLTARGFSTGKALKIDLPGACDVCGTDVFDYGNPPYTASTEHLQVVFKSHNHLMIHPNPFNNYAVLNLNHLPAPVGTGYGITVYDNLGRIVRNIHTRSRKVGIARNGLAAGAYIISVQTGTKQYAEAIRIVK
jgi:hypothetical protein